MKIMWLCNAPIPQVAEACKISNTIHEGWLISVATELERRQDVQFVFVMPNKEVPEGVHYTECGNSLYVLVNQKNNDKGRQHQAGSGHGGTQHAFLTVAGEGGAVDGNGAGSGLGDDGDIHHVLSGDPLLFFHAVIADH